jgi:hypothetical protein
MPTLSYHFGLSPGEIWDMTHREYQAYLAATNKINQEMS